MDVHCGLIEKGEMWARILIFNDELIIYVAFLCVSQRVGLYQSGGFAFTHTRIG